MERYSESTTSLTEFVKLVKKHSDEGISRDNNGTKIWKFIKSEIIKKHPEYRLSATGISREYKNKFLSLWETMKDILKLCKEDKSHLTLLQESAIALGNSIEAKLGTGTKAVSLLEALCEEAYIAASAEVEVDSVNKISDLLKHLGKEIKAMDTKLCVVFLPYKYGMWDSLESVYFAANADNETEARVIPIPYFELDEFGKPGKVHFEISDYLGNIPVELYSQADLEEIKPDAIFIHNPYDANNYITMVHPDFFAERIKDFTDELVYIPYCLFSPNPIQHDNVRVPGVVYSHHVFLQSEEMRDSFIKGYEKFLREGEVAFDRDFIRKKFLGPGSPKVDKLLNYVKNKPKLPIEWEEKIYKDGERKKIIFIDTHISMVTYLDTEGFKNKLESILAVAATCQEAVFIWRPHPLTEEYIISKKPELLPIYQEIVNMARSKENVIFDDTKDAYVALSVSDGMLGAYWCSMMISYETLNRPALDIVISKKTE